MTRGEFQSLPTHWLIGIVIGAKSRWQDSPAAGLRLPGLIAESPRLCRYSAVTVPFL